MLRSVIVNGLSSYSNFLVAPFGSVLAATSIFAWDIALYGQSNVLDLAKRAFDAVITKINLIRNGSKPDKQVNSVLPKISNTDSESDLAVLKKLLSESEILPSQTMLSISSCAPAFIDAIESDFSPYRTAAEEFVSKAPKQVSTDELIVLTNYYFSSSKNLSAYEALVEKLLVNKDEAKSFINNRNDFVKNWFQMDYGSRFGGKISDPKVSQLLFLLPVLNEIEREQKSDSQKFQHVEIELIKSKFNKHLVEIYQNVGTHDETRLALLYVAKFLTTKSCDFIGGKSCQQNQAELSSVDRHDEETSIPNPNTEPKSGMNLRSRYRGLENV
ncbi:MAG: hypothetical protein EBS06_03285 [Proteobacteria bacterium]|nr:hypothetical protein [Pseudomonadota bacterium]